MRRIVLARPPSRAVRPQVGRANEGDRGLGVPGRTPRQSTWGCQVSTVEAGQRLQAEVVAGLSLKGGTPLTGNREFALAA